MEDPLLSHPSSTIQLQETSITIPQPFSTRQILVCLTAILVVAAACILANHLASYSFEISVINSTPDTPIGRLFNLMFVSNGKISQILYHSNRLIEQALYPNDIFPKKPFTHVSIHLSIYNISTHFLVQPGVKMGEFSIILNPSIILSENLDKALKTVLHRAMAHVRVWNGPNEVVSAIIEYLTMQVSSEEITTGTERYSSCWSSQVLRYNEGRENGFVARLNWRIRDRSELGSSYRSLCEDYTASLTSQTVEPSPSTSDLQTM